MACIGDAGDKAASRKVVYGRKKPVKKAGEDAAAEAKAAEEEAAAAEEARRAQVDLLFFSYLG